MKNWLLWGMMLLLCISLYSGDNMKAVVSSGEAEIPREILETLDPVTREMLTEEPKYLALTFDDGPRRGTTDILLNGLQERGVPATFFVVGEQIEGNEDLILRMKAEGHQIGNHTYSHTMLLKAEKAAMMEEIRKTEVMLEQLIGGGHYWLRPPYGLIDVKRAAQVKTPMIYWSVDPEDWDLLDTEKVVARVMEQITNKDIILLHDFYPTSVDAALELIDRLQEKGYTFVTVEELFRIQGIEPEAGLLYASPACIRPLP